MEFEKADPVWIPKSACVAFYLSVFSVTLQLGGFLLVAGIGLEPMTSGLWVRIYTKCRYDYTMVVENNRQSLRLVENVF